MPSSMPPSFVTRASSCRGIFPRRSSRKADCRRRQEPAETPHRSLAEVEREHIQRVLSATQGNRREAAKILGIGEATLYRRLGESQRERKSPQPSVILAILSQAMYVV